MNYFSGYPELILYILHEVQIIPKEGQLRLVPKEVTPTGTAVRAFKSISQEPADVKRRNHQLVF